MQHCTYVLGLQPVARTSSSNGTKRTIRTAGEAMSFRSLGKYALAGLIAVSPATAAHTQAGSAEHTMSANDLARAVVANELKVQEGNHSRWMYRADKEEQGR